ncbi:PE-PGRS family protein [Peterkaempfera bronchialis]|uniref:PE-PGRS family protein n=1 Tax=Peterkaempfera bronchialis TaxID=2126346 RepID=A0A345SXT9_9ACTN|nr:PE-PGRS family protein [Peterkaempfera bronchialis]AXI78544.1 PE-PGRS family protein [Peterkaempfera bronchialis]
MEIGENWAYRAQPKLLGSALRRVEIVRVGGPRRSSQVHVRFLEGEDAGLQDWVAPASLVALWDDVAVFQTDDVAELALAEASRQVRKTAEFETARMVLGFVRPKSQLRLRTSVADAGVLELTAPDATADRLGLDAAELRADPMVHQNRAGLFLAGWPVTERIARRAAAVLAEEILPEVERRQEVLDQERAHPSWQSWHRRDDRKLQAEDDLLRTVREWCGQEQVERFDELLALRAEVERLGAIVERALKALRDRGHGVIASTIERDLGVRVSSLGPEVRR